MFSFNHYIILGIVTVWIGFLLWIIYSAYTDDPWYDRFVFHTKLCVALIIITGGIVLGVLILLFESPPLYIDLGVVHKQVHFTKEKQWKQLKK
jgi:hypothetical protein